MTRMTLIITFHPISTKKMGPNIFKSLREIN